MSLDLAPDALEAGFAGGLYGVSARRIYEHMAQGQINPFGRSVSSVRTPRDVAGLIDVVRLNALGFALTGLTLAGLEDEELCASMLGESAHALRQCAAQEEIRSFAADVEKAVKLHALRRAARNVPAPFLPSASRDDPFGVPMLRSRLREQLSVHARAKAGAEQWFGTINNLTQKGLRSEELCCSGLFEALGDRWDGPAPITGAALMELVDFSELRLSVIANIDEARTQLRFEKVPERPLAKIKEKAKPQAGQQRRLHLFDRVMGYRIEHVQHTALWGHETHWQAIMFDGSVLRNPVTRRTIFDTEDAAVARAQAHARTVLPKLLASECWADWSWTGGQDYREWLVTLPFYRDSFLFGHFDVRNVLAHVRCDLRESDMGERVLMVHEVQSDWAQEARRAIRDFGAEQSEIAQPPFLNEWPALTMKLMLLHAAHLGVDALGWTRGAHQVHRYRGLGKTGLTELYDRTLPREVTRMLKPFGMGAETIEVYVPANFKIRRIEGGFEVSGEDAGLLGVAPTFRAAREMMPDGAHEQLYPVHGVRLSGAKRAAILEKGFVAWG